MVKIGVIGEHPQNDARAFINLLKQWGKHKTNQFQYNVPVKNVFGSGWDSKKAKTLLKIAFQKDNIDFVIYTRDLDGLPSEQGKINQRQK